MEITTVFLDWDNTLVDFFLSERNAFTKTWSSFDLPAIEGVYERYSAINDECWKMYERREIEKKRIYLLRYERLFAEYGVTVVPADFNARYLENLAQEAPLFEGAETLCRRLKSRYRVYIVTNGDARGQFRRIAKSGLADLFDGVFVSEAVGVGKPDRVYWEYVFSHIDEKDPARTLIIGDSPTSDMQSGLNMGMKTLWLNLFGAPPDPRVTMTAATTDGIVPVLERNGLL